MPIDSVENSETISTTEHSLPRDATYSASLFQSGDYVVQLWLDLSNLVSGDAYTLRLREAVQSSGTQQITEEWYFNGAQAKPAWVMPSVILLHKWDLTMVRTAGTDKLIEWSIRRIS